MLQPAQSAQHARVARVACLPCRQSKRRCDRRLPACNLCIRKEVECSYPRRRNGGRDTLSSLSPPRLTPESASAESRTQCNPNAVFFLAPHIFRQARLELPRANPPIPEDVGSLIGDSTSIREIATAFFTTTHRWLPIVSKRGVLGYLLNPLANRRVELSLLVLCMKLCSTRPVNVDGNREPASEMTVYRLAKRFHRDVEASGLLSIQVLQAGLLIALYEIGHAIYPAAYLSVGVSARYGLALGIDKLSLLQEGDSGSSPRSWNEIEEKRRVWWAVLVFDRFLSVSNPRRPLSTEDPTFESYLPIDDSAWDDETAKSSDAVKISNGFTLRMGNFARMAQTTFLLSQALRDIRPSADLLLGKEASPDQTAQLRRTLLALVHAADSEGSIRRLEFCAQSALSLSTIILLQDNYYDELDRNAGAHVELAKPSYDSLWMESRVAVERLSTAAMSYNESCPIHPDSADHMPIFVICVMYQVVCLFLKVSNNGTLEGEMDEKVQAIKQLLQLLSSRWQVAGVYLSLIEAQEITMSADTSQARQNEFLRRLGPSSL